MTDIEGAKKMVDEAIKILEQGDDRVMAESDMLRLYDVLSEAQVSLTMTEPEANRECAFCGDPVLCNSCFEEDAVKAAEARYDS